MDLGANANLRGFRPFPPADPWNTRIDTVPVDSESGVFVESIGADKPLHPDFGTVWKGAPNGIQYVVVGGKQAKVAVRFEYKDESDPGPYPVPPNAPVEGGPNGKGDRHTLVVDRDNKKLYELFSAFPDGTGWRAGSGAVFDLRKNTIRRAGFTSADAAGLPIFPGLARFDEVAAGEIRHALRFTVRKTRQAYVFPATHFASRSSDPTLPPMGLRVRLKAAAYLQKLGPQAKVIAVALQRYGLLLADNGGDWFVSGAPNPKWDNDDLNTLKTLKGHDFEVVRRGKVTAG